MRTFADVLMHAIDEKQSRLVVGLDPRIELIPNDLREPAINAAGTVCGAAAEMILSFNRIVIDIVAPYVPAVKVQIAFYEVFGAAGYRAYEDTIRHAVDKGLVVIGDVKRSDIGSTAHAYAHAHLGASELNQRVVHRGHAHAITIVPYFGWDGIEPFLYTALENTKGLFVIVRTSNPTAHEIQGKEDDADPIYLRVAAKVNEWGRDCIGDRGYSAVGAVIGATFPEDIPRLREAMPRALFLLPGYGAQGADAAKLAPAFDANGHGAVVASSRKIIHAYGDADSEMWEHAVEQAVNDANADLAAKLPPLKSPEH
jgi:orotidine-5'-phosphate decarboxylase